MKFRQDDGLAGGRVARALARLGHCRLKGVGFYFMNKFKKQDITKRNKQERNPHETKQTRTPHMSADARRAGPPSSKIG